MTRIRIRRATARDVGAIVKLQYFCYPNLSQATPWRAESLELHQAVFPQGQFVAVDGRGRVVGHCANLIVHSRDALRPHSYDEMTGQATFTTHDPDGDTLYGAEVMVRPRARRQGIGSRFYAARFRLVRRLGLRYYATGGRLPGYEKARHLPIEEYVRRVVAGDLYDPVLTMQTKVGLRVRGVMPGYLPDVRSRGYATLLAWENPAWMPSAAAAAEPVPLRGPAARVAASQ